MWDGAINHLDMQALAPISHPAELGESIENIAQNNFADTDFSIYPNPVADLIAIQVNGLVGDQLKVELIDVSGRLVRQTIINAGQTITHFNTQTLYAGIYFVRVTDRNKVHSKKIEIQRK